MMDYRAFATDYDGTIARNGSVETETIDALQKLKDAGIKTVLVTGREIPDLLQVFSEPAIFDLIVAENGGLLYWPILKVERLLAEPPPVRFAERLRSLGVKPLSVGRVIVATMEPYEGIVRDSIRELNLELLMIPNKGSLMILPNGIDKGTGLLAALKELELNSANTVAVGDAENDHALFRAAGFSAAVANALPELKSAANWVSLSDHGRGVRDLVGRLLANDLPLVPGHRRSDPPSIS